MSEEKRGTVSKITSLPWVKGNLHSEIRKRNIRSDLRFGGKCRSEDTFYENL